MLFSGASTAPAQTAPSAAARPTQPSRSRPIDAFAGRGPTSAVPMHNSRSRPVADTHRRPTSAGAVPAATAPSHILKRSAADRPADGSSEPQASVRPASASMASPVSKPAASELRSTQPRHQIPSRPSSASAPIVKKLPADPTSANGMQQSLQSSNLVSAPGHDAAVSTSSSVPAAIQLTATAAPAVQPRDGEASSRGSHNPSGVQPELLYQPGDDADQNGFVTTVPELVKDSRKCRVAVSNYPAGCPASQVQMHAAAAAALYGKVQSVSVHMDTNEPALPLACIRFQSSEAAEAMAGQRVPSFGGKLPAVCELPAHQSLPLATTPAPGVAHVEAVWKALDKAEALRLDGLGRRCRPGSLSDVSARVGNSKQE